MVCPPPPPPPPDVAYIRGEPRNLTIWFVLCICMSIFTISNISMIWICVIVLAHWTRYFHSNLFLYLQRSAVGKFIINLFIVIYLLQKALNASSVNISQLHINIMWKIVCSEIWFWHIRVKHLWCFSPNKMFVVNVYQKFRYVSCSCIVLSVLPCL